MTALPPVDILWLDDAAACDVSRTGGKAANLSRLAVRHPVPTGFCLTAVGSGVVPGIEPNHLQQLIVAAYGELARRTGMADPPVAVRSSATDEDGTTSSFAGQFDTYLNITGAVGVCDAVARCLESAENERVRAYRQSRRLDGGAGVAVLVQHLVQADTAAVAFSANPVTGNRDEIVINANFGLGESVVGGMVTPDTYIVSKTNIALAEVQVARKTVMTVPAPDGTREVPVPRLLQTTQAMTSDEIERVARLTLECEAAMGFPVDVECAFARGQLYLLQCRPITRMG
jgi:phosphoenolpyruvate synthase/pyruvate phosphate dikinase